MKKLVLAAALAVTAGLASAQVSLYGQVNQYLDNTKTGTANGTSTMTSDSSRLGIRATEDLGGGLSARAVIETAVTTNDPASGSDTQLGNRQSTVGLAGATGSLDLGRFFHNTFLTISGHDAFGTQIASVAGDVHNTRDFRFGNALFASVTPVKGLTVSWDQSMDAANRDPRSVAASYDFNNFRFSVAQFDKKASNAKSTVYGANATFGKTGVYFSSSVNKDGATESKGNLLGLTQEVAPAVTLKASYGTATGDTKAYNVGATYAMSKRTNLDMVYRNLNKTGTTNDVKQVVAGIRHTF